MQPNSHILFETKTVWIYSTKTCRRRTSCWLSSLFPSNWNFFSQSVTGELPECFFPFQPDANMLTFHTLLKSRTLNPWTNIRCATDSFSSFTIVLLELECFLFWFYSRHAQYILKFFWYNCIGYPKYFLIKQIAMWCKSFSFNLKLSSHETLYLGGTSIKTNALSIKLRKVLLLNTDQYGYQSAALVTG